MPKHKSWHDMRNVEEYKLTFERAVATASKLCSLVRTDVLLQVGHIVSPDEPGVHQFPNAQGERYYDNRKTLIHAVRRGLHFQPMGMVRQALIALGSGSAWEARPTLEHRLLEKDLGSFVKTLLDMENGKQVQRLA